jgi:transcriptional adapter 3
MTRWAEEDVLEEQRNNLRLTERRNKSSVLVDKSSTEKLLKQSSSENISTDDPDACPFGSLTQRLLSALIDENPTAPVEENPDGDVPLTNPMKSSGKMSHRPVPISHAKSLEARLQEELTQLGIFENSEEPEVDSGAKELDDEVLAELVKKQEELHSVAAYNRQLKDRLVQAAEEEMKRQTIRNHVLQLDTSIIETRQRLLTLKSKKKALSKKEKDAAWRTIRERNRLLSQLQMI